MDTVRRMKMQHWREKIVQDVNVDYILDHLISKGVITTDELELILTEKTTKDKTRHLLDLLPKKTSQAFDEFVAALEVPYPWLSKDLQEKGSGTLQYEENHYLDSLLLGGLPQLPPYNVDREEKTELQKSLNFLQRGHYVVLHGMTGSGKSCLAVAALQNKELIIERFNCAVYWMSVGDVSSDDLLCHMTDLMEKLSHHPGIETEKQVQSSTSVQRARESLKRYFLSESLREGLLILDDVSSSEVIDAFDVGCKILVTTKDSGVMRNVKGRHKLIKISEGFTEPESLNLLAQYSGIDVENLPSEAKKIHKLSKGNPMVMALIGSQLADNKDDVQRNTGRWNDCLDKLTKRNYGIIKRHSLSQENGLLSMIGLCVKNLPEDMRKYYQDFALFVEDVNIKPEVLCTLWSKNRYEVEDIMSEFLKKSLAVSKWNEFLNSYVYGIHDLLLCYLKNQQSHNEKKALHRRLLDSYMAKYGDNFSNLPNDNYIFSYIGYHLSEAEMWDYFQKLFLDLEFIGTKLKVTGPGDLLVDYKKYHKFITCENEERKEILQDFEQFVQTHGLDLLKYQDLDVVQCGLQEPQKSHVYKEALKIAKSRPKKLYVEFLLDHNTSQQPEILSLKEEVFAACFTSDEKRILVANGNGVINLWGTDVSGILYKFPGHKQRVVYVELNPDGTQFLSCSEDCTVKLWNLDGVTCKNQDQEEFDEHGCALKTPSPRMRQYNWSNMFSSDKDEDRSYKTFNGHKDHVVYATYSQDGKEIISCSKDGTVKVWNCNSGEIRLTFEVPSEGSFANRCIFSEDNSLIFFGGDDKTVYAHDNFSGKLVESFTTSGIVIGIMNVADNEVAVVTHNSVTIWIWDSRREKDYEIAQLSTEGNSYDLPRLYNGSKNNVAPTMINITPNELSCLDCAIYTCAVLSKEGAHIIASASDNSISVWDVDIHKLVQQYHDQNGLVRCLDTFWGASYQRLLSGSDDRTIKIWHLELPEEDEQKTKLQPNFDALWDGNSSDPSIPLLVAPDSSNKLQLLRGRNIVTESVPETAKVMSCKLSSCGNFVVYGCCDGHVKVFDIKKKHSAIIMKLSSCVHYLQLWYCNDIVVIAAGEDNSLKIWRGMTFSEISSLVTCAGQTDKVVQCFLINMGQKLLSCAQDGSVKVWETGTGNLKDVLVGRHSEAHITAVDLSSNEDLVVLCDVSGNFLIFHLEMSDLPPYIKAKDSRNFRVDLSLLRCCKLSYDAQYLALGQDSGNIVIWDIKNEHVLGSLKLHKSWVQNLLFAPPIGGSSISPPPVILVSVADQIGWWDISRLPLASTAQRRRMSSGQRRRRRSGDSPRLTLQSSYDGDVFGNLKSEKLGDDWIGKEGAVGKLELLGCIKIIGREATKISASKDFSAFATVDTNGIVYLMKILR